MRKFIFIFFILFSVILLSSDVLAVYPGMLAYGQGNSTTPMYRIWNGTGFGAASNSTSIGGIIEWLRVSSNPVRDEHIIVTADTGDDVNVIVNSSSLGFSCWHNGTTCNASLEVTSSSTTINRLKADVAHEQLSGDGVLVYSDNSAVPKYRIWNGTRWSSQQNVPQTLITTGVVSYVKMAPRPGTDEIALIMTNTTALNALIWNGTNWTCQPSSLLGNLLTPDVYQHADLAYEQLSGDLFIVASVDGLSQVNYTTKQSGSCIYTTAGSTTLSEEGEAVVVNSRPNSDYLLLAQHDIGGNDLQAIVWNGTSLLSASGNEVSTYTETSPDILMAASWAGASDFGLLLYSDAATSLNLDYFRYNISTDLWAGGNAGLDATGLTSFSDEEQNIFAYSFVDENKSLIIVQDDLDDLWAKVFDGNTLTWADGDSGVPLEANHSAGPFPSFDFNWITFRADSIAPNVTSLVPSPGSLYNQSNIIEVAATVVDNGVLNAVRADILLSNGTSVSLPLSLSSSSKYNASYTIPSLGGRYRVTIVANDSYNNINSSESTYFDVDANFTFIFYPSLSLSEGYASGSSHNLFYNGTLGSLTLNASLSGTYLSRIFDNGTSFSWSNISWVQGGPYSVALPDGGATESSWLSGNANMSGNVLLLHFDETSVGSFTDSSGLAQSVLSQDVLVNQTGRFGSGYGFFSNVSNVSVTFASSLNPRTALTMEAWVNWTGDADQAFDLQNIITNGDPDRALRITEPQHFNGGNQALAYIRVGGSLKQVYSTQQLSPGEWYHLAAVYNDTSVGLYVNGLLSATTSASGQVVSGTDNTYIGYEGIASHFNGTIDEVALYNRSLSASEILDRYKRGAVRLNLTVRSCDDAVCAGDSFVDIPDVSPQNLSVNANRYFQYNVSFTTLAIPYTPELYNVSISASSSSGDVTSPLISVVYPLNTSYNELQTRLNYTVSDASLQSCWYTLNGGVINTTVTCGANLTGLSSNQGSNTWTVYANDSAGNSNSSSVMFFVDSIAPLISFGQGTVDNASFVSYSWIYANVSASDTNEQTMVFTLFNATSLVNQTSLSAGTRRINWTNLPDGTYYYNVSMNDTLGNSNWTETRTIVLDSTSPSADYVSPTEQSGVARARSFIEVNVTASDVYLGALIIRLYNNTHGLVNQSFSLSSSFYVNITGLSNGIYFYNASVNDSAGNLVHLSTRNITLDMARPLVSLVYPTAGNYTSLHTLLNYTVSDSNLASCWYSTNGGSSNTSISCGTNVTGLSSSQGTNVWTVYANDSAGNANSSNVSFFVDSIVPQISFASPTPDNASSGVLSWLFVNVSVNESNVHSLVFSLSNRTSVVNRTIMSSSVRTFNWTNLPDEIYYYNVTVNDTLGNTNWTETRTYTLDSNPPSVTGLLPPSGSNLSLGSVIEIAANVSDSTAISSVVASITYPNTTRVNLTLSLSLGTKYNSSFIVPYLLGRYNVSVYANDSLNNQNVTSTTFFNGRDGVAPLYSNAIQYPASPTSYIPFGNYTFNITWTDDIALDTAFLEFNSVNYTMSLVAGAYMVNLSNLAAGSYGYRYLANDSSGNWNSTGSGTYVISKASANLTFLLNSSESNLTLMYGGGVNASALSSTSAIHIYRNSVNVSSENHLFVVLGRGEYNYTASALENQNYSSFNITRSVTITPAPGAITLLINGSSSNQTGVYGVLTNVSVSTPYGSVTLYRNGLDITGSNHQAIQLAAGDYNFTAVSSGNTNYSSTSTSLWSHIIKAPGNVTLLLNDSATNLSLIYPGQVNASARSSTGVVALLRNDVNVTSENNVFIGLQVGSYNYTGFAYENQNYTNASHVLVVTVSGTLPVLNITISPSSSIVYPTASVVTGTGCPSELSCVLYRNNISVSNPDSSTLGAGTYVYVYNTTGNANYSGATFSQVLTVNQSTGLVHTSINHSRSNMTLELGQSVYLNATLINGSGLLSLFLNGALINQGVSPLSNLTTFSSIGTFNITSTYTGNENYSSASESWFVSVVPDALAPSFGSYVEDPANGTIYSSGNVYRFNVTISENYAIDRAGIEFQGVNYSVTNFSDVFNFSLFDLAAGTYSYYWWANDSGGNYNTSGLRYYTVSPAAGNVSLLLNGVAANLSVAYLTSTNFSASTPYGTITLFMDGTDITVSNHLNVTRAAGTYNITARSQGDQNHSSLSVTYWLSVSQIPSNVSLFVNHSRSNLSVVRGTTLPINASLISGEGMLSVYVDSTLIYTGSSPSYNLTNFTSVGLVNVSVLYAQTQNYSASSENWFVNVTYPAILELVCEAGGPYQSNATVVAIGNVSYQGAPLGSHAISMELRNASQAIYSLNVSSASDGGFEGLFANMSVGLYSLNVSSSYLGQNASCIDGVQVGGPAQLVLDKLATIYGITNASITYNISLRVVNTGASSSVGVNISDANSSSSPYDIGTLESGMYVDRSYLLTFDRGSSDSFTLLSQAFAQGIDSYAGSLLSVNSTVLNISIPGFSIGKHVTLVKNIVYIQESTLNVTYNVSTLLYNSGEEDLSDLVYLDTDISSQAIVFNLTRANSTLYSSYVVIAKAASNTQHTFALATATIDALTFYGNQPIVTIPGYGGPADALVHAPIQVSPLSQLEAIIEVRNMNPDIGQDFEVDYWITSNDETVNYSSGAQTIYVPASGITNTTVTLTAPAASGLYRLRALVRWTNGVASAYDSFEVVSEGGGGDPGNGGGSGGGGGGSGPVTGAVVTPHIVPSDESDDEIVCTSPYIRHGAACCLDQNGNFICDSDEVPAETPRRNPLTGLFTFNLDGSTFVRIVDLLLILLISLAIVLFCILAIMRILRRRRRDSTRLTHIIGMDVYTTHGKIVGRVKDVSLENYRVASLQIALHREHGRSLQGISVPYNLVRSVKEIILIDEKIIHHLVSLRHNV